MRPVWIALGPCRRRAWLLATALLLVTLPGCQAERAAQDRAGSALARLKPTAGNAAAGEVTFTPEAGVGVRIRARVEALGPGLHGFHIHERGDCSAADASSAGGHYNPHDTPHGSPLGAAGTRHVGDLGNLTADSSTGEAVYERVDPLLTLTGPHTIVGRSVIVHAGEDDLTTQPTGGAGARIACGVIAVREGAGAQ